MFESQDVIEKKLNVETNRLIGELQLSNFGNFLDEYNRKLESLKKAFPNNLDIQLRPIALRNGNFENTSIINLTQSDNTLLSKILSSLTSICEEINLLTKEAQSFYNNFLIQAEYGLKNNQHLDSVDELIDLLQKVYSFVKRCRQVINLLLRQLCAILGKDFYTSTNATLFPEPLDCLAELLVCLMTLDYLTVLPSIKEYWFLYRRSVRTMLHNSTKFNYSKSKLGSFDKYLSNLEKTLLTGNIFKETIEKCLEEKTLIALKNTAFSNELLAFINHIFNDLERDDDTVFVTRLWLQINVLIVFENYLFHNMDKKHYKKLLEINKKISACVLVGNILWYPEQFLIKHIPIIGKLIDEKAVENARINQISNRSNALPRETNQLIQQSYIWLIDIEKMVKKDKSKFHSIHLQEISNIFINGLKLIKRINESVKWITNMHVDKNWPMAKSVLLALCRLVELLKCFQFLYRKRLIPVVYAKLLISQHLSHQTLSKLQKLRRSTLQEKSYKNRQLDVLSALKVCEDNVNGPNTSRRILTAKLALSASGLSQDYLVELKSILNRLEIIQNLDNIIERLCDCSFLYWHQNYIIPMYLKHFVIEKSDISTCYLLLSVLNDCNKIIQTNEDFYLKNDLFSALNQIVETNLRFQTHSHLQLPSVEPLKNTNHLNFTKSQPALIGGHYVVIKKEIEHYLSTIFFNLTTVVLYDWKTYGEMRRLAYLQYNLETVEDNLPMQTLEQGLDVLEIMRNINVFVGKYLYNLNTQVFFEDYSNNKYLNTINISHIANSIRTHGTGIMNTAVNFTYQFLKKKFQIFSQFMFDEHIKSRLLKDLRFFTENKVQLNQMYPYERADKFNHRIKNLGLNQDGLSYLDLFRKLITQIGNAMGYVRLIKSGGRRFLANTACFIPDLKKIDDLNVLVSGKNQTLPEKTRKTLESLLDDLKNLSDNFEEATEYFKLLVDVFIPVFRDSNNLHLKNFFTIVPSLTINFVEYSLTRKEKLNKKNRSEAAFTDDGFAMGLAYIIELLGQEPQLNSLHWFQSVRLKFMDDRLKNVQQKNTANKSDDKLIQTLTLTEKRINTYEKEFQLLYYNYNSARIFFQL